MNSIEASNLLGIMPTADAAGVRKAFRAKSMQAHPDKGGSAEAFKRLIQARDVMLGKKQRSLDEFDEALRRWAEAQARHARFRGARVIVIRGFSGSTTTTTWSF